MTSHIGTCTAEKKVIRSDNGLDLSRWEEWLAVRVPQSLLDKMMATEIVAHCLWEMTFYGFTQEQIAAFRVELENNVKEIDAGTPELVSGEQAKGGQEPE